MTARKEKVKTRLLQLRLKPDDFVALGFALTAGEKLAAKRRRFDLEESCQILFKRIHTFNSRMDRLEAKKAKHKKASRKIKIVPIPVPEGYVPSIDEYIYVPTRWFIDHEEDDREGGLAKVVFVGQMESLGETVPAISVAQHNATYNWKILAEDQETLKKEFGRRRARQDGV